MKKALFPFALLCFALTSRGQTPDENVVHACRVLSMSKPVSIDADGTAFCNDCYYWPFGIVPYEFDANLEQYKRDSMLNAMARLEVIANLHFVQHNNEDHYIYIKQSDESYNYSSNIGLSGGEQEIGMLNWNVPMIICHELMHALGFWHEQSRPDRDNYVTVHYGNMCPGSDSQFDVAETGVTPNIPYDFTSIMHYGSNYFSKCANPNQDCEAGCSGGFIGPTLEIKPAFQNGQNFIGNRAYFSRIDSLMLRFTYPFPSDRFVNLQYTEPVSTDNGWVIYKPLPLFSTNSYIQGQIPPGSDVWVMPGTYEYAEGSYSKPMTLRAPFGGVVLK